MYSKYSSTSDKIAFITIFTLMILLVAGCKSGDQPNPSGTLEATEIELASTMPGRVLEVRTELGGKVSVGDTLVILDTELLRLQKAQTATGLLSISAQRTIIRDGISQAETHLAFLNLQNKRITELVANGTAQQQQLDEVSSQRSIAEDQLKSAKHQLATLDAEEARLKAGLAVIERQISEGSILSPITGDVLLKAIEPGEVATPGKVLLRISDLSRVELRVFIGSEDLGKIKVGQDLKVKVDAHPGKELTGKITWVSSESEFTPKNAQTKDARLQLVYAVKIAINNPDGSLRIGMPAEAVI